MRPASWRRVVEMLRRHGCCCIECDARGVALLTQNGSAPHWHNANQLDGARTATPRALRRDKVDWSKKSARGSKSKFRAVSLSSDGREVTSE